MDDSHEHHDPPAPTPSSSTIATTSGSVETQLATSTTCPEHQGQHQHLVTSTPSLSNTNTASSTTTSSANDSSKKKRLFAKELRCMMYGFGDDQNPYTETVDMLEDLVIHFIGDMSLKALDVGKAGRVTVEDVMYLVRRDPRKYARVKDLLSMNEELKRARKAFDEVKYVQSA